MLEGLGEDTAEEIFEFCYPALSKALTIGGDVPRAVQLSDALTTREGIQMTITRLILLVMAIFVVVFAFRVFGSRFLKK